jgi:hypothetical protein
MPDTIAKHIPGPWRLKLQRYGGYRVFKLFKDLPEGGYFEVGDFRSVASKSEPNEETIANATLIAAAPDLLAACHLAMQFWYSDHPNDTSESIAAKHAIREAINKAEGAK